MPNILCNKLTFSDIEAVIFDKDGTLENSHYFLKQLTYKISRLLDAKIPGIREPLLLAFGLVDDSLDVTGLMAVGSREENIIATAAYIAETGLSWFESKQLAEQVITQAHKEIRKNKDNSPIFPGVVDFLANLSRYGFKIAILSADTTANVQNFLTQHNLREHIQVTIGGDGDFAKPDPRLYQQTCQKLGVQPSKTIMIGDSQGDIRMAKQAQAGGTIGICWHQTTATHLEEADVAIASLQEIQIYP